jgi:hypothetical protein
MLKTLARLLLPLLFAGLAQANAQLDSLKNISAAGAPFLALKMLDQAQPSADADVYEWILWEQERYRILSRWQQWDELLLRIEGLPEDLPAPFLQQAASYRIRAYIALGQHGIARRLLREQLWRPEAGEADEYRNWRRLVVETYLGGGRNDDASIAMRRLQQDFPEADREWLLLRARVLMKTGRYDEVIEILSGRLDWQSLAMKLLAEYRSGKHSPQTLWDLALDRIKNIADDPQQLATYWSIAALAAESLGPRRQVEALEARLGIAAEDGIELDAFDGDRLWRAYLDYARLIGNRNELLVGDDAAWLELAAAQRQAAAVKARSLYALLIDQSADGATRQQAAEGYLALLDPEQAAHQRLLDQLFNRSRRYADVSRIPLQIRFHLVDIALKKADIPLATRLMSGLDSVPPNARRFDWLLRRARVLLLGGKLEQGDAVLDRLIGEYDEPQADDTDRILQVLFDLQTLKADEQAIRHFRQLMNKPIEARQRREILFWMADSFKALEQYERAALLYLQSAMFIGPDAMDPWAQTARYNAAESLQQAGLVDDARRIYEALLKVTREPARRSVLRHNIQQLWLIQNAG